VRFGHHSLSAVLHRDRGPCPHEGFERGIGLLLFHGRSPAWGAKGASFEVLRGE